MPGRVCPVKGQDHGGEQAGRRGQEKDDDKEKQKGRGESGRTSKDRATSKKMKSQEKADWVAVGPPGR